MSSPKFKEKKPAKIAKKNEIAKNEKAEHPDNKRSSQRSQPLSTSKLTRKTENFAVKTPKTTKTDKNRSPVTSTPKLKTTAKKQEKTPDVTTEIMAEQKRVSSPKHSADNVMTNQTHSLLPVGAPSAEEKIVISLPVIEENPDSSFGALKKKRKKMVKVLESISLPSSKNLSGTSENKKLLAVHPKTTLNVIKPVCSMIESDEEVNTLKKNHGFLNYEKKGKKTVFLLPGLTRPITRKAPCLDISKMKVINPISNIWKNGRIRLKFAHDEKLSLLPRGRTTKLKFPKKKTGKVKPKRESLVKVLAKSTGHHPKFGRLIAEQKAFVSKGTNMHTPIIYDRNICKRMKPVLDNKCRNVACSNGDLRATKDATTHAEFDIERYIDEFLRKNKTLFSRRYYNAVTSDDDTD